MSLNSKVFFIIIILVWCIIGGFLPVTQDEAYYMSWNLMPDWGYFDHPPFAGWLGCFIKLGSTPFIARLGNMTLAGLTLLLYSKLLNVILSRLPLNNRQTCSTSAILLTFTSLGGLLLGVLVTPDSGLLFAWVGALYEASLALRGKEKRWVSCGLYVGLGLLSKYTMVLMGPVLLIGLVRMAPHQLRRPWPYLGGLVALFVFCPNLIWNHQHNWVTFRFQFGHGFSTAQIVDFDLGFPKALEEPSNHDLLVAAPFLAQFKESKLAEKNAKGLKAPHSTLPGPLKGWSELITSQLSLFGLHLFTLLALFISSALKQSPGGQVGITTLRNLLKDLLSIFISFRITKKKTQKYDPLMSASFVFPLGFFLFVASFSKVEANWPVMFIFGASYAIGMQTKANKGLWISAAGNIALLLAVAFHAHTPFLPIAPHKDRIRRETVGFQHLARIIHDLSLTTPVFGETYQIVAMTRYYEPEVYVEQWNGLTRPSDYNLRQSMSKIRFATLSDFYLIHNLLPTPSFSDYQLEELHQLRICPDGRELYFDTFQMVEADIQCKLALRNWYIAKYTKIN